MNPEAAATQKKKAVVNTANGTLPSAAASAYPYLPRGVFGSPVPQGATANVGQYYCGPLCLGGSFIAIVLTVGLMSWACVSLCCGRGRNGTGGGGAPAGSMSSLPTPHQPPQQQQQQQQRPVTAPAASSAHSSPPPVALSLRPTRYERFEDAPEEPRPPPLRPGSASTPPPSSLHAATPGSNPFASSYPAQPPPAWAPNQPLPPPPAAAWPGHGGR